MSTKLYKESDFQSVSEFYPFYLSQHQSNINRKLHGLGTFLGLCNLLYCLINWIPGNLIYTLIIGYGLAWTGHFFFEHNKPATFQYPLKSFCCDFLMMKDIILGNIDAKFKRYGLVSTR